MQSSLRTPLALVSSLHLRANVCACRSPLRSVTAPSQYTTRSKSLLSASSEAVEAPSQPGLYFVATNNFKVKEEYAIAFEEVWKNRESHLNESPGFIRFALLRGDTPGEYVSQTFWASRQDFEAWTKSKQFGQAHGEVGKVKEAAGSDKPTPSTMEMLEGRPQPKFYEAVTVTESEMF